MISTMTGRRMCRRLLIALVLFMSGTVRGQATAVSAWDAADFRIWGYIPYWASSSQISNFATNGMYTHVSDVLYFGAVRPQADGDLTVVSSYARPSPPCDRNRRPMDSACT